jgi:cytochrome P450
VTAPLDLFEGAFWRDPYPAYAELRADTPVRHVQLPDGPVWVVSRYEDVRAALTDPRFSKDWRYTLPADARDGQPAAPVPMMILMDPPGHTRLRKLVSRSFTARRMTELRPRVRRYADELLDAIAADGPVDLIAEYAALLPVRVICELLGVPEADREEFTAWSRTMIDEGAQEESHAASAAMFGYLGTLVDAKRAEPDDALLSALVEVSDDGDRLSVEELVAMAMLLLIAGHETTVNLIGNGTYGLLTNPDQLARLRAEPALLASAVEEFLRWDAPVQSPPVRFLSEDVEVAGTTIPAGSVVMLSLAAANRDGEKFPEPDALRVDRDASGHVAFGYGVHFCLGAQLARIEGQEAFGALLSRFPDIALAVDPAEVVHRRSTLVRGLTELPVRLTPPVRE